MNFIEEKILAKGTDKNLVTRFPPEPSGYLHIGHAKAIVLNFGLAEKYNGKCNLRMDDTNPANSMYNLYEHEIVRDVEWLGYKNFEVLKASRYFDIMEECIVSLIFRGLAYVDFSTSDEIAEMKGTPTKPGTLSPDYELHDTRYHVKMFDRMLEMIKNGVSPEGTSWSELKYGVVRARIDMNSSNMLMRDPVIYRVVNLGSEHNIIARGAPMYDFAHPLSDIIEGITDSLCTLEFEVHRPLYEWVVDNCLPHLESKGFFTKPEQTEFNRLNIGHTIVSKRKLSKLVSEGVVNGWDDPRMPTIAGLRRRGYTPTAIKAFCEKVGWTKNDTLTDYGLLESCLRDELNKTANRYMAVIDPIKLTITNWTGGTMGVEIENNPEDPSAGKRMVSFSGELYIEREDFKPEANRKYFRLKLGGEVRLKGAYVVKAYDYIEDDEGNITEVLCTYDPDTMSGMPMERKVKGTIHWVSVKHALDIEVREYDRLFTVERPEREDDFMKYINEESLMVKIAYCEGTIEKLFRDGNPKPIQFIRKGYYMLDPSSTLDNIIFNRSVTLKETWNNELA